MNEQKETFSTLDPVAIEDAIAEALTRMASQGSVPAANAALKLVEQRRQANAASDHAAKLEKLSDDPIELARYFGEVGLGKGHLTVHLGRPCSPGMEDAIKDGARSRQMEVKAIELARARSGGKIESWMKR